MIFYDYISFFYKFYKLLFVLHINENFNFRRFSTELMYVGCTPLHFALIQTDEMKNKHPAEVRDRFRKILELNVISWLIIFNFEA